MGDSESKIACFNKYRDNSSTLYTQALLEHNAKVYVAARNPEKAEKAIEDLKKATGKQATFLKLDLADLKSVKAAAEEFNRFVAIVDYRRWITV